MLYSFLLNAVARLHWDLLCNWLWYNNLAYRQRVSCSTIATLLYDQWAALHLITLLKQLKWSITSDLLCTQCSALLRISYHASSDLLHSNEMLINQKPALKAISWSTTSDSLSLQPNLVWGTNRQSAVLACGRSGVCLLVQLIQWLIKLILFAS